MENKEEEVLQYGFYQTEFGFLKIGYTESTITFLKWTQEADAPNDCCELTDRVYGQMREYLDGKRKQFDFRWKAEGTEFQRAVWKALTDIPYGETRTYGEIAMAVGRPKAGRAVGMANHDNPLWVVIPCHRVLGAGGKLTGYAGGLDMKAALLRLEQAQVLV